MRKLLKLLFRLSLFALVIISGILAVRTIAFSSRQILVEPVDAPAIGDQVLDRISAAIRIPTVSYESLVDTLAFRQLDTLIEVSFPLIDSLLEKLPLHPFSRGYKWPGTNPKLLSILLMAHSDVAAVEESSLDQWTYPPFSGQIADDHIWGRGTLDDKAGIFAILEAVSLLLSEDYQPERTVYLAFGHDEENGGRNGAARTAEYFSGKGIRFEYILDEGLVVLENSLNGLDRPLAMIGVAEKGFTTLTLTARLNDGGHSSMPPGETAADILSRAVGKLEREPFPAHIDGATAGFFDHVAPEMSLGYRILFSNLWLTQKLVVNQMEKDPAANAMIRTTAAPAMLAGSVQETVLPTQVSAKVDFRILPGETVETVVDHVGRKINDERVIVADNSPEKSQDPSPVSETEAFGFQVIQKTIQQLFPDVVVAPSLVAGTTDSRYFCELSHQVYRFMPVQIQKNDRQRVQGINERLSVENYKRMIVFYRQLIINSCK